MDKIIYTKYSNERDDKFRIRTNILDRENIGKIIRKSPLTKNAIKHVVNMYSHYLELSNIYPENVLNINKCTVVNDTVEFEYIEGETLEKKIDMLLEVNDYKGIIEIINLYCEKIRDVNNAIPFQPSEEFVKIFGNVTFDDKVMASSVSDIDIIFSNIIINSQWYLIDYEWTFNFSVPFNFTIYRAVYYFINSSTKRKDLLNLDIFKLLEISDNEIEQYKIMEENFQNYIIGKSLTSWGMYNKLHGKCVDVKNILTVLEKSEFENEVQIFYDYGEGFSEDNSTKMFLMPDDNNRIKIRLNFNDNIKGLRIDPSNDYCIIMIDRLLGFNKNYYEILYNSNGSRISDNTLVFSTDDPQIYITNIDVDTTFIELDFCIMKSTFEISLELSKFVYVHNMESKKNTLLQNHIQDIEKELFDNRREIEEYNNKDLEFMKNIQQLEKEKHKLEYEVKEIEKSKYKEVSQLKDEIETMKARILDEISEYEREIKKKDDYISRIEQSKFWKFYKKYMLNH